MRSTTNFVTCTLKVGIIDGAFSTINNEMHLMCNTVLLVFEIVLCL